MGEEIQDNTPTSGPTDMGPIFMRLVMLLGIIVLAVVFSRLLSSSDSAPNDSAEDSDKLKITDEERRELNL